MNSKLSACHRGHEMSFCATRADVSILAFLVPLVCSRSQGCQLVRVFDACDPISRPRGPRHTRPSQSSRQIERRSPQRASSAAGTSARSKPSTSSQIAVQSPLLRRAVVPPRAFAGPNRRHTLMPLIASSCPRAFPRHRVAVPANGQIRWQPTRSFAQNRSRACCPGRDRGRPRSGDRAGHDPCRPPRTAGRQGRRLRGQGRRASGRVRAGTAEEPWERVVGSRLGATPRVEPAGTVLNGPQRNHTDPQGSRCRCRG